MKVVEGNASCEVTYSWVISTLMQLIRFVEGIECRGGRDILQETSSHIPYPDCHNLSSPWAF